MKKNIHHYLSIPLIIMLIIIFCSIVYLWMIPKPIKYAISSIYQAPKCMRQTADKFGIEPDRAKVKEYIINSVELGMTLEEVKEVLGQFGEVSLIHSFTLDNKETVIQVLVRLCETPWNDIVLDMRYSEEGYLISFADSNPQ